MKRAFLALITVHLFLSSCLFLEQRAETTPENIPLTPSGLERSIYKDGLVSEYQDVLQELPYASVYDIRFNIDEDLYHITGNEEVIYTNAEDVELNEIRFHLFPNILGGEMHVTKVQANDKTVMPNYALKDSLMIVSLNQALQPEDHITLLLDFNVTVPKTVELNYGVEAYSDNVLALAHAYPVIAVYDDEGWNAELPPQSGDITYADMAFYIVTVEAPSVVQLVGSGRQISHQDNGSRQTVKYEAGPARDFYLAASSDYEVITKESNGVILRFYTKRNLQKGAEYALEVAAKAIEIYGNRYAPYPYSELDFVSTPTLALGIEYPGMIAITDWIIEPDNRYLEGTIAHEVGHQWFYNLVGNDQLDDPWLDESLTQFATLQYFTDEYNQAGKDGFSADLESRWARVDKKNIPIGLPVRNYTDKEYGAIVYGRGPLFFNALRDEIGSEKFDLFIKNYVKNNAWKISTPEILKAQAEQVCGCNLTPLFKEWIYP